MTDKQINVYVRFVGQRSTGNGRRPTLDAARTGGAAGRGAKRKSRKGGLKKRANLPK